VLFRLEIGRDDGSEATVLVQSEHKPSWETLLSGQYFVNVAVKQINYVSSSSAAVSPDTVTIQRGECFSFRVVANPTVKRRIDGKKNGRRDACITDAQQLAWLVRKGEHGGFRLVQSTDDFTAGAPQVIVVPLGRHFAVHAQSEGQLCHYGVRFDGLLQVTDPSEFIRAMECGVGSGKAFGYGLLSIARP
jgi:CRISPR system Cascade subunit CasE